METPFPDNKREERHLYKAFELLETERVVEMLQQNGIHRKPKVIQHDFRKQTTKWWMAAAVVFIATVTGIIYKNMPQLTPLQLADNSLSTMVVDYNFSYRSTESSEHLSEVQKAFNSAEWEVAANQLEIALSKTHVSDTNSVMTIYFYKGIVDLQQNNFDGAILNFTPVAKFNSGAWRKDAIWLRALAHIKNNNLEFAKADLKLTAQFEGWKKADEAVKILKSMNVKN